MWQMFTQSFPEMQVQSYNVTLYSHKKTGILSLTHVKREEVENMDSYRTGEYFSILLVTPRNSLPSSKSLSHKKQEEFPKNTGLKIKIPVMQ